MTTYIPHWTSTASTKELTYTCDHCGAPANTIHFVPWWSQTVEHCLFACSEHDPGGYWTDLDKWIEPKEHWLQHMWDKGENGQKAIALWEERIRILRDAKAAAEIKQSHGE